jgi:hypothetical protein
MNHGMAGREVDNRFLPDQYKAMSLDYIDQRMAELRPYV